MNEKIKKLFENFITVPGQELVVLGRLPEELILELDSFVDHCRKIKEHNFSFLKEHNNIGQNTYQVSVPQALIENSYILPYINYLGEHYLSRALNLSEEEFFRKVVLRKHQGHFDGYDFWINFCNKDSINHKHNHTGTLSGIIYYKNDIEKKTHFENFEVIGQTGDILLFPSYLEHWVESQNEDYERITFSFNLIWNKPVN